MRKHAHAHRAVVRGGRGALGIAVMGGVEHAALPEILRHVVDPLQRLVFGKILIEAEVLRQLLYGLALVLIMLNRPSGLWPAPRHEDRPDADIDQPDKPTGVAAA